MPPVEAIATDVPGRPGRAAAFRCAAALFLLTLVIGGLAAALVVGAAARQAAPSVTAEAATAAQAVGTALRDQLDQARGFGIPLAELPGIDEAFAAALDQVPGVAAIAVEAGPVAVTVGDPAGAGAPLSFALGSAGPSGAATAPAGEVRVWPVADIASRALGPVWIFAAGAVLVASLLAAAAGFLLAMHRIVAAEAAVARLLDAIGAGVFRDVPHRSVTGAAGVALRAVQALVERVKARRRAVLALADELRGIDFDGSLTRETEAVLAPVEQRWRFGGEAEGVRRAGEPGRLPWAAPAITLLGTAAWTLAALFGGARDAGLAVSGVALPAPLIDVALAALALLLLGRTVRRGGRIAAAVICIAAGAATLATFLPAAPAPVATRLLAAALLPLAAMAAARPVFRLRLASPLFLAAGAGPAVAVLLAQIMPSDTVGTAAGALLVLLGWPAAALRGRAVRPAGLRGMALAAAGAIPLGALIGMANVSPADGAAPLVFAGLALLAGLAGCAVALSRTPPQTWVGPLAGAVVLAGLHGALSLGGADLAGWALLLFWAVLWLLGGLVAGSVAAIATPLGIALGFAGCLAAAAASWPAIGGAAVVYCVALAVAYLLPHRGGAR